MKQGNNAPTMEFSVNSERVKMIDVHPKEPILITALYSGVVSLWNYGTAALVKSFDTGSGQPVRCARFIPRLQSFICGADDRVVRVYNYNTMERTKTFQAHDDFIRCIAVHEHLPIVLTCSDDFTIRQWDWSKGWTQQMIYDGHMHYCMSVTFNPKDPSSFASASLDGTVKVWSLNNPTPNFQLEGHENGVNCVEYYPRGDKPYLLTGSDDNTVRLWDYQTKACVQVFSFHTAPVSAVLFYPDQPLIITVAENTEMKIISTETFRLLYNMDNGRMGRGWTLAALRYSNILAIGYDSGFAVFKIGDDKPVYSMDANGRVLVATGNEITRMDIRGVPADTPDGEVVSTQSKDMGAVEASARSIVHGPNPQYVAIVGENDYNIVSTLTLRPKSYGKCLSFIWGPENGSYAVLEGPHTVKVYRGSKECVTITVDEYSGMLFTGPLFAVCSAESVTFYDWATLAVVRRIAEHVKSVQWSPSGELVALATEAAIFLLKFDSEATADYLERRGGSPSDDLGELEFAFELVEEVEEVVQDIAWVGDCLVFINRAHRLNYYIGGEVNGIAVLSRNQYLLGYLPKENRIFCIDKEKNITSYLLDVDVIEYMAAIVREDFDAAAGILPSIKQSTRYKLAQFLQARNLLELAAEVTTEEDHRFDLAIQLRRLPLAHSIVEASPSAARWKQVGDMAIEQGYFDIAIDAFGKCLDFGSLLLIYSALNDLQSISKLGDACVEEGRANVAFTCFHLTRRFSEATDLLVRTGKVGEAAFYARTYCPGKMEDVVAQWKITLASIPRLRESLAMPSMYPNLFPSLHTNAAPLEPPVALNPPDSGEEDASGPADTAAAASASTDEPMRDVSEERIPDDNSPLTVREPGNSKGVMPPVDPWESNDQFVNSQMETNTAPIVTPQPEIHMAASQERCDGDKEDSDDSEL